MPLEVDVIIGRYQGDKRVASLPYVLNVNAQAGGPGPETQLNMSSSVGIPSSPPAQAGASDIVQPFSYRAIGSIISLRATLLDDGRFELALSIDDSSVSVPDLNSTPGVINVPVLRSFKSRNTLLLRDGQQRQFTAATDRVTGEVVKIDVTARALK